MLTLPFSTVTLGVEKGNVAFREAQETDMSDLNALPEGPSVLEVEFMVRSNGDRASITLSFEFDTGKDADYWVDKLWILFDEQPPPCIGRDFKWCIRVRKDEETAPLIRPPVMTSAAFPKFYHDLAATATMQLGVAVCLLAMEKKQPDLFRRPHHLAMT